MFPLFARYFAAAVLCGAIALAGNPRAEGKEEARLTAPLYPGAKSVNQDQICREIAQVFSGGCSQFSADPLSKVKAFYDQKIGAKRFVESGTKKGETWHWAPLGWFHGVGEDGDYNEFPGVTLSARVAPAWPATAEAAQRMIAASPRFKQFGEAVDWSGGKDPGNRGLRSPRQLMDLYAKYKHLEGRYFMDEGAVNALHEKYDKAAEARIKAADQQREKEEEVAAGKRERASRDLQSKGQTMGRTQMENPEMQADRKEMDALMRRKPALWAKAKPHYEKGQAAMNQGNLDVAEKEMAEAQRIVRTDPEVAAMQDKHEARARARAKSMSADFMKGIEAASSTQGDEAARAKYNKAKSDALWENGTAYLEAVAKLESYATLIKVEHVAKGEGKDFSDKPEVVARKLKEVRAAAARRPKDGADEEDSGSGASAASARKGPPAAAGSAAAKPQTPPEAKPEAKPAKKEDKADDAAETAKKAGQEGLKMLKKLF